MPTIPLIQDSAQLEIGSGRQRVQADAGAFGAHEARNMGAISQGLNTVARVAQEKDDEFNVADARELDNELSSRIRDRLHNPETGYLSTQRGRNAIDGRGAVEAEIDELAAEIGTRARSPRAAALYQDVARRRVESALGDIAGYAERETRSYQNEVSEAAINEAIDNAVAAYSDPAVVQQNRGTVLAELSRLRERNGWDDQVYNQRVRQFQSDVSSRIIVQLATTDPEAAQQYFDSVASSLTAQNRAELQTTMRAAQRQALERIEGMAWQAFANGRPLASMGEEAYREFTSNPLYGSSHAQVQNAYRVRAQSYADGVRQRDNSAAYRSLVMAAMLDRDSYIQPGRLEEFVEQNADTLSTGDILRAFSLRDEIANGGDGNSINDQSSRLNALRNLAGNAFGIDLNDDENASARALNAALLQEMQRSSPEEDPQIIIGRAVVGMNDEAVRHLPRFRVQGNRGRTSRSALSPRTEAVVPYEAIDPATARALATGLMARLPGNRNPTRGEVEHAYAAMLRRSPDETVDEFYARVLRQAGQ